MKNFFLSIFCITVLNSCKNDNTKSSDPNPIIEESSNAFSMTINGIVRYDGEFALYYLLDGGEKDISDKQVVIIDIIGSTEVQKLFFQLPNENELPIKLILKFNSVENIQDLKIMDALIEYNNNDIFISAENFYQYFIPNEFIDYKEDDFTYTANEKNGLFRPCFFSRKVLDDRINFSFY